MYAIRPATPAEIPQVKALWKKCFRDPAEYIDAFYNSFCTTDQVLVVVEDGRVRSMASLLPASIRDTEGEPYPAAYLYALATDPDFQGHSHARQLLQAADELLVERGYMAMALVPASPSLHKFFKAVGMDECFAHRKSEFLASSLTGKARNGTFTPIGPEEYNAIRESYLHGSVHVAYSDDLIRLQELSSRMTGGGLFRVEVEASDAEVGCAAIEYSNAGTLLIKELLTYHQYTSEAVEMAAKVFPAKRYLVRTPAAWEGFSGNYIQPFGMVKWYDPVLQRRFDGKQDAYLGLAFD